MREIEAAIEREVERCVDEARKVSSYGPDYIDVRDAVKAVLEYITARKVERIAHLEKRRKATVADALMKLEGEDWHGVADAAMDLRDIDNELDGLRYE